MVAIETRDLPKYYGDTRGVEDLDLAIEERKVFGYLGTNGAGKTTTIRTLLGFVSPTSGGATVLGRDVTDRAALREARRRTGYVPGELGFDEGVTGETFLDYQERLKGGPRRGELAELFTPPLSRPIDESISAVDLLAVHLLSFPYLLACAALGILLSAVASKADVAQRAGLGLVFAMYLLESVTARTDYEWIGTLTFPRYYDTAPALTKGEYDSTRARVLLAVAAVLLAAAAWWFGRRDL